MKAWIVSDLHATHADLSSVPFDIPEGDICLCAGDISDFLEMSLDFLKKKIAPSMPIIAVLGNHDFYGGSIEQVLKSARRATVGTNIRILENEVIQIGDIRVIAATLWTDYEIPFDVEAEQMSANERRDFAVNFCRRYMLDYREIYRSNPFSDGMPGLVTSGELIQRHHESRAFIATELAKPWSGKTIVLSHHAPSPRSLLARFAGHPSNAAFASDLSEIIHRGKPDFWIHGHVHEFFDYAKGKTRVICNPRGYRQERQINGFRPDFVIEL
ncbi:metallophosphoesterase [Neorhizobium alkalisoli]|uniref:metallophosphoesterase n=1 Tax=Neorhizobium alkalisoli TaxID=528178 RepID=UPI000CF9DD24|nr:metallophosphoesterase [Neorhizobium alkalisoli]